LAGELKVYQSEEGHLLTLIIESTVAPPLEDKFNENMHVQAVKVKAMAKLNIDPSTVGNYGLVYQGNPLPEDRTLKELSIPNKAILVLTPISAIVI
jgi:hypothetical protein